MSGKQFKSIIALGALASVAFAVPAIAQNLPVPGNEDSLVSFRIAPTTLLDKAGTMLSIARTANDRDIQDAIVDRALDYRLGLEVSPIQGLSLSAESWRNRIQESPLVNSLESVQSTPQGLFLRDPSAAGSFNIDNPLVSGSVDAKGFHV